MLSLLSPWPWLCLGVVFIAGVLNGAHLENKYGANARLVASIQKELATKNAELTKLQAEDAEIVAKERASEAKIEETFSALAPHLKKCVLDKAQVEALNKVGG